LADEAAKEAALSLEAAMIDLTSVLQNPCKTPVFIPQEEDQLEKLVTPQTSKGKCFLLDGKEVLSKLTMRERDINPTT
jgi:hypothetical protein